LEPTLVHNIRKPKNYF